jgi:hypothetical protein
MELRLNVGTGNRFFAKAMLRVRPSLEQFLEGFCEVVSSRSSCDAILVGVTDDKPADYFEEIDNTEGFFQVVVGCPYLRDDVELTKAVFDRLVRAIKACPMPATDTNAALAFAEDWRRSALL